MTVSRATSTGPLSVASDMKRGNTAGTCTTDTNGQCSFTYQGPELPGADLITAYPDLNNDGVEEPNELSGEDVNRRICEISRGVGHFFLKANHNASLIQLENSTGRRIVRAERQHRHQTVCGTVPVRLNELAEICLAVVIGMNEHPIVVLEEIQIELVELISVDSGARGSGGGVPGQRIRRVAAHHFLAIEPGDETVIIPH